jgi:hypothetical protein
MKTAHSILFVSALFATFMAAGMEKAPPAREAADSNNCSFVQDSDSLRLMLLYHNPVRGAAPAPCGNAPPRPDTVAG